MTRVYLDHNATTSLRPEAREVLLEHLARGHGNPSSTHASGRSARAVLDDARERIAAALSVPEDDIFFTSGGTESNNLAILGALRSRPGSTLVTSPVEHPSVIEPCQQAEREGHPVHRAQVDEAARVNLDEVREHAIGPGALVSLSVANNEVGTLTDLSSLDLPDGVWLHTDAVQALGRVPIDIAGWGADLVSLSSHKVGGPLGVGLLLRKGRVQLAPLVRGGGQEADVRAGTENVAAIAAAAVAIELAVREQEEVASRTRELTALLWQEVQGSMQGVRLLGPPIDATDRLPNTLNLAFDGVEGRVLVARLDLAGLEASAGSACASGSLEPSHVLVAMGLDEERARAGLRLSLGRTTLHEDIHTAVEILRRTL